MKDENGDDDDLDLSNDHVYPEFPNLDAYGQQMPGDSSHGEFNCEHCEERFTVSRQLRLHIADEHLYMTGGAGPAGTLDYGSNEEAE